LNIYLINDRIHFEIRFLFLCFVCLVLTYLDYSNISYVKKTKSVINDGAGYVSYWIVRPFKIIASLPQTFNEIGLLKKNFEADEKLKNTISQLQLENEFLKKIYKNFLA